MTTPTKTPGTELRVPADLAALDFTKNDGDVLVVAQDADDGRVLMVARADHEALSRTLATGEMWYRSRTRGLWHKGGTSGHLQRLVAMYIDCDGDSVLALVRPAGPSCHTGAVSCFGTYSPDLVDRLDAVIDERARTAAREDSYTVRLLDDRNLRLKKLGEEAAELAVACSDGDPDRAAEEAADLLYHVAVALRGTGGSLASVRRVLASRAR
jgi:phosphoribosyl-ATP pyrophosphohydrolase/phosphoribosyl-AMP cyclohydrolase